MNATAVEQIADAVLYEGYNLYPYRPSSVKNRQRWTFGGVFPRGYCARSSGETWSVGTECLAVGDERTLLNARARFLHLLRREVAELAPPLTEMPSQDEPAYRLVECLRVGGEVLRPWEEAVERTIPAPEIALGSLASEAQRLSFAFPAWRELEPVRDADGLVSGVAIRTQQPLVGELVLSAERVTETSGRESVYRISVRLENLTPLAAETVAREEAQLASLVSAHVIMRLGGGRFVSQQGPPPELAQAARACSTTGLWPVLAGDEAACDTLLASPIILYDFPEIAPESPGDLFDGTEIDEILTLRIMTMTDAEKQEARSADPRTRALLDRTEALPTEQLAKLHGALRSPRPVLGSGR